MDAIPALIFLNVFQLLFPIHSLIAAFRELRPSLSTLIAGGQTPTPSVFERASIKGGGSAADPQPRLPNGYSC